MQLGDVLRKERIRNGMSVEEAAEGLRLTVDEYATIEAGGNAAIEAAAQLVLRFNEMVGGQVGQLYYPCGIPFTEVQDYDVSA